jgi:nucleotide-binding universal stress UspA family protein
MSTFCRVITGVSGSPRNLQALRYAAVLARGQDAALVPILAWVPPGGDVADRRHPSGYLRRVWLDDAERRLAEALDTAFGGRPDEVPTEPLVVRGDAGRVLVREASHPGDLLVIGTGRHGGTSRMFSGKVGRYCLARASCPVLSIPPTALELAAGHGLHRWAFRHSGLTLTELTAGR